MHYSLLASDYDGTLAHDGTVSPRTIEALERLIASGREFLLITGRKLPHLQAAFPRLDLCTYVIAENGALFYQPAKNEKKLFGPPPSEAFIQALRKRGVFFLSVGDVIIATSSLYKKTIQKTIDDMHLDLQVILNKRDLMILPAGIDKASGLTSVLQALSLSPNQVVGVGDAENDLPFLLQCGYSVAVQNALPQLKEQVHHVTQASHGDGVRELINQLLANDLQM